MDQPSTSKSRYGYLALCLLCSFLCGACGQQSSESEQTTPRETPADPEAQDSPAAADQLTDPQRPTEPPSAAETGAPHAEEPTEPGLAEAEPTGAPASEPRPDESPGQAVRRCERDSDGDDALHRCLVAALDERDMRAAERERVIDAHKALGNVERAIFHMRAFVEQYPRDRRGNGYRLFIERNE